MITFFSISLIVAFLLRVLLSFLPAFQYDMDTWYSWADRLVNLGFDKFYDPNIWTHYTPGYLYILWVLGLIKKTFLLSGKNFLLQLFKFPNNLADILTALLIYKIVIKKSSRWAWLALVFYLFNPALIFNSSIWGQADSFLTFLMLVSFYFLLEKENVLLASLSFALAFLTKPQALFLLPVMVVFLIKRCNFSRVFKFSVLFLLTCLFLSLPFFPQQPVFGLPNLIIQMGKDYPYTTLNAFNFWRLFGNWQKDSVLFLGLSKYYWGLSIYLFFKAIIICYLVSRKIKKENYYLAAGLSLFAFFLFPTRIHERYLLPSFPFLLIASCFFKSFFLVANFSLMTIFHLFNLSYVHNPFPPVLSFPKIKSLSAILSLSTIAVFLTSLGFYLKKFSLRPFTAKIKFHLCKLSFLKKKSKAQKKPKQKGKSISAEQEKLFLVLILGFSLFIRILNLFHPQTHMFDEVYHAFTAQEMYKGNMAAWEWWNTPPKGFAYEWTHPPMAKLLMMAGISLFGSNSFGWRFPGTIFGTGVVFLIYLLGKELFSKKVGILAAILATFESLLFVMSRIGMSDIYFLFFSLAAILARLKKKLFLSTVFFGFALATKWTALYLLPVILLANFIKEKFNKKLIVKTVIESFWYLTMAVFIYLLSYWPFLKTHSFDKFIELQKQMWWYHTGLKATHTYQSRAYTWPLMLRPVWFYVNYQPDKIANIYALGNPLILWPGLVLLPYTLILACLKRQKALIFSLLAYFSFWVPWIFSPRIMFLYHYLPSIPFLCLALAWQLERWLKKGGERKFWVKVYLLLVILTFLFFYPHLTGILVPKTLNKFYYWLPSWR